MTGLVNRKIFRRMRGMGTKAFVLGAGLCLVGCASVTRLDNCRGMKVEDGLTPIETVEIFNSNWLLLSFIPIASGDPDSPNEETTCPFRDTVTVENQMKMLEAEVRRTGARKAINVMTVSTDETAFMFLLMREKLHTTAVLVK